MGRSLSELVKMKLAVAVVAAVSVTGIAAAGAVVSDGSTPAVDDPGSSTTTSTLVGETTTTTTTEAAPLPAEDPTTTTTLASTDPSGATCETHGQRVSRVAHETPPGPGHGAAVSAAAHDHTGECGTDASAAVVPAAPTPTVSGDDGNDTGSGHEVEAPETDTRSPVGGHGQGHGRGGH